MLLAELQAAHDVLLAAMAVMDAATRGENPERNLYSNARWRLSQASLNRRALWRRIFAHMMAKAGARDAAALQSLQSADVELLQKSAAHVGKWTVDKIEADWRGYCESSRAIRQGMEACIGAEKRVLYPLLKRDAIGGGG
jgi:hypothetical protein